MTNVKYAQVNEKGEEVMVPITKEAAYDQARKEFYDIRHADEIERRVAREEALSTGAQFGKTQMAIGMELENKEFNRWRIWAQQQVTLQEQARSAAYTGITAQGLEGDEENQESGTNPAEAALDELEPSVPGSKRGQTAKGRAAVHP